MCPAPGRRTAGRPYRRIRRRTSSGSGFPGSPPRPAPGSSWPPRTGWPRPPLRRPRPRGAGRRPRRSRRPAARAWGRPASSGPPEVRSSSAAAYQSCAAA
ncbi:MAG TPA: hypothetical protein EYH34_05745, partial [Planctomycetes bacterium]|nr:hypothetical protein [Planctomycetota bacterium]